MPSVFCWERLPMARSEVVSSSGEYLILVDEQDQEIGSRTKRECHAGDGILHRAFSIFTFNQANELLLQQRARNKPLWPGYWSNTCCSHPRRGETMDDAVSRRLQQELGFECPLDYLYKFKYHAQYEAVGSEHEYCWVYHGRYDGPVDPNMSEIESWRFIGIEALEEELQVQPEQFTPWFKLEWTHIRDNHLHGIISGG
jgi:isopentenyl-diphosphate delta-isomerase